MVVKMDPSEPEISDLGTLSCGERLLGDLQQRAEQAGHVVQQPLVGWQIEPMGGLYGAALGHIGHLKEVQTTCKLWTPAEHTDFEIQFERSSIKIGRPDHEQLVVDRHGLGVEQTSLKFLDFNTSLDESGVVTPACEPHQLGVVSRRHDERGVDTA